METVRDIFGSDDPFALFDAWFADATAHEPEDPNAVCLATVDESGQPSARMVLMKAHDRRGFVFYTNLESRKGQALAARPTVALLFHWKSLRRQVRIEGPVTQVSPRRPTPTTPPATASPAWAPTRPINPARSQTAPPSNSASPKPKPAIPPTTSPAPTIGPASASSRSK